MFFTRFTRLWMVCIIALIAGMAAHPVFAAQSVDPSTLNPPPPPEYNPVCYTVGSGVICDIKWSAPESGFGTGIICGSGANSFEIMGSGDVKSVNGHRYYDTNLNLVERRYQEVFTGGTAYNPKTGAYLNTFQLDTVVHKLTVPGDINSGDLHVSGFGRFYLPKGDTVLVDTGTTVLSAADGSIVSESAHHPLDAFYGQGDVSAIQPLCDALMK